MLIGPRRRRTYGGLLSVIVLASLYPMLASGTRVTIRIQNVSDSGGIVRVALCLEAEWEHHNCSFGGFQAAVAGVDVMSVEVPPGTYGILVHHDANGDGQVNKNFLGLPVEGVGFSRNAKLRFGFPSFAAVSLPVAGDEVSTSVSLFFEPLESHPR